MRRYRAKPPEVEAEQTTKRENIKTHLGIQVFMPGDWLVKIDGALYWMDDETFRSQYEPVEDGGIES
uniref:Uncharacterized protein n=1 Tax=viral metagenome TaxID=1070528 RepID=A0A6H1ZTK6_9ZZZZ